MTRAEAIEWIENIKEKYIHGGDEAFDDARKKAIDMAIEALQAEPVIYCKDCEYWQDNNGGYPHDECRWGKGETPDSTDYCSFGEKADTKGESR